MKIKECVAKVWNLLLWIIEQFAIVFSLQAGKNLKMLIFKFHKIQNIEQSAPMKFTANEQYEFTLPYTSHFEGKSKGSLFFLYFFFFLFRFHSFSLSLFCFFIFYKLEWSLFSWAKDKNWYKVKTDPQSPLKVLKLHP